MRLRHGIGLAVFCLLAGSRWLVDLAWHPMRLPLMHRSLACAIAGTVALSVSLLRPQGRRLKEPRLLPVGFAGLLLFGFPLLAQTLMPLSQPATAVALYALAPLCIVLGIAIFVEDASRALMMPALAGFAGALLLLPWRLPSTRMDTVACSLVLASVVSIAAGSIWLFELTSGAPLLWSAATIGLSNAAILGFLGAMHGEHSVGLVQGDFVAILVETIQLLLLLWLVSAVAPERLASRFFLVPLVTVLEGAIMLRATLDVRMVIGVLLLMVGAGALLSNRRERGVSLSLKRPL